MKKLLTCLSALSIMFSVYAADCEIAITVVAPQEGENIPAGIASKVKGKLTHLLAQSGLASSGFDDKFFLTGRFDNAFFESVGSTDRREALKTTFTMYIGDADDKKIYASYAIDLSGVGRSQEQAYTNALNKINGRNKEIQDFLAQGRQKILDYFNSNYQSYLNKARAAVKARDFDEALYWSTQIPECCVGYAQAAALTNQIYGEQVNYIGANLLAQAKGAWAADPTAAGAREAFSFISQMDPASSSYPQAMALAKQMENDVKQQWVFENVTKYNDELEMRKQQMANEAAAEKARIKAAKAIGVAYAQNRPKVIVRNYHWW